jgi:hypothetical protein
MKWTAWDVIRLLLVVAASMAGGMALVLGFGWLVLWLDKVVKGWHGNIVWGVFSTAAGVVLILFILWDRIVTAMLLFKGYSAKQVLFGDAPHRLMRVEQKWEERKRKWRRFFGR